MGEKGLRKIGPGIMRADARERVGEVARARNWWGKPSTRRNFGRIGTIIQRNIFEGDGRVICCAPPEKKMASKRSTRLSHDRDIWSRGS